MTIAFFIAIALGVLTDAAVARPALASVAVARDSRRAPRTQRAAAVRFERHVRAPRAAFPPVAVRRLFAPLTGAGSPRAPARCC